MELQIGDIGKFNRDVGLRNHIYIYEKDFKDNFNIDEYLHKHMHNHTVHVNVKSIFELKYIYEWKGTEYCLFEQEDTPNILILFRKDACILDTEVDEYMSFFQGDLIICTKSRRINNINKLLEI